jgi:hypothetical protein
MGEVEPIENPVSGRPMCNRKDVTKAEKMVDMMWFEPAATEAAPAAYYVPASATKAIALLQAHGIQMRAVTQAVKNVEQFTIAANTSAQNFEGHAMRRIEGSWAAASDASAPRGSLEVLMHQPLARLAFYLIEPASDDGLVAWNFLDDELKDAKVYPILRRK